MLREELRWQLCNLNYCVIQAIEFKFSFAFNDCGLTENVIKLEVE